MPKFFTSLPDELRIWALEQQVFFISSAPFNGRHINISPKGLPSTTLTFFDSNHCAYVDAAGSGSETISHLYENGRATIMFCSFDQQPRIMRLFCTGRVIEYTDLDFEVQLKRMGKTSFDGARAILLFDIFKVQTACGYAVPLLSTEGPDPDRSGINAYLEDRKTLGHWANQRVKHGEMEAYQAKNNARSLDGLGGLREARRLKGETIWLEDVAIRWRRIKGQWDAIAFGAAMAMCMMVALKYMIGLAGRAGLLVFG